jgi:hypothetical protein
MGRSAESNRHSPVTDETPVSRWAVCRHRHDSRGYCNQSRDKNHRRGEDYRGLWGRSRDVLQGRCPASNLPIADGPSVTEVVGELDMSVQDS